MKRSGIAVGLVVSFVASAASADELGVHASAWAAHAVGGAQQRELGSDDDGHAGASDSVGGSQSLDLADRIQLDDVLHFETGIRRVKSKNHWLLVRLAQFINKHPEIVEITIEGHADATGSVAYNQELSEARAASARKFLVKFGVDPERVKVVGHGMAQLRVPTIDSEEKNRRVEFWVTKVSR